MKLKTIRITRFNGKLKINNNGIIYILLLTIALLHQTSMFDWYYLTAIFTSIIIFGIAIISHFRKVSKNFFDKQIYIFAKYLLYPWLVLIIYNLFLQFSGIAAREFTKTSLIQIMFAPCILLGAVGGYYLFEKNTLRYFLCAVVFHYIIMIIYKMNDLGISEFIKGSFSWLTGIEASNPFETNSDLVLSLGLLVIYYCNDFIKDKTKEKRHFVLVFILIILGGKRIELLALIAICFTFYILKLFPERKKVIVENIISLFIIITMLIFIYLVTSNALYNIVQTYKINTMGRIQMWDYVSRYAKFSPYYMGKGYGFSNLILERDRIYTYMGHTYVLHSDILKIYFDLGFVGFGFWAIYNLFILPKLFRRKWGLEIGTLTWFMTLYLFLLYFTDNCINYYACQTVLVILILQSIFYKKNIMLINRYGLHY